MPKPEKLKMKFLFSSSRRALTRPSNYISAEKTAFRVPNPFYYSFSSSPSLLSCHLGLRLVARCCWRHFSLPERLETLFCIIKQNFNVNFAF